MIATRRGLVVLAAIAGVFLVVLVIDLATRRGPIDRTLVPGFDEASVTRLQWTAHPVGPYLTLERVKGQPWRRTSPTPGAIEQAPIASLLATLRGARWHRSEIRDARDEVFHLAVGGRELWIGLPIEGSEQAWIRIDDRSYLVDAWVTRALTPTPIDLAITTPLAGIPNVPEYTVGGMRIAGNPRSLRSPSYLVLEPAFVAELERALVELAIDSLPMQPAAHGEALVIEMAGTKVSLGGPCEQRVYLAASTGDGCVPRAKADAVTAAVAKLHGPAAQIAARAPVPIGIGRITLVDGKTIDLRRRPRVDGADVNSNELTLLMLALRSPVDAADVVAAPTTQPIGTLAIVTIEDGIVLELHPGNLVRRTGESVALRLAPEAFAVLLRGASTYKDATPWREDATTIDEITIDQTTWKRGDVLGEWVSTPPAPRTDVRSIDTLVAALAAPNVVGVGPATVTTVHRLRLVVRPPVGDAIVHTLELGAPVAAGCPAILNGSSVLLSIEICRLVPR